MAHRLHSDAKIATWDVRAKAAMCRLIYKYRHSEGYVVTGLATRLHDGPVFKLDIPKNNVYARSTSYMCRKIWNSLPGHIRSIDVYEEFRIAIKRYFNAEYFGSVSTPGS